MKRSVPLLISMAISVVFVLLHLTIEFGFFRDGWLSDMGPLRALDRKALDFKFSGRSEYEIPPPEIIIAAVDEKSLDRYGLWPWNRTVIADFITQATRGGAAVIAFDVAFTDFDKNTTYQQTRQYVEAYRESQLLPESQSIRSLTEQFEKLHAAQVQQAQAITDLEAAVERSKGNAKTAAAKALKDTKLSADLTRNLLEQTQANITSWKRRSEEFYGLLNSNLETISPDAAMAKAVANSPQTILGYINYFDRKQVIGLSKEDIAANIKRIEPSTITEIYEETQIEVGGQLIDQFSKLDNIDLSEFEAGLEIVSIQAPLEQIANETAHFGFFNALPDPDGPLRQLPLLFRHKDRLYPSLALKAAALYFDYEIHPLAGQLRDNTFSAIEFGGDLPVPTNENAIQLINYYKDPAIYFPTFSLADIIDGTVAPTTYEGKIIMVGATALGLFDLRPNPFNPTTPGVYIHAMSAQNMIDGLFLQRFEGVALIESIGYLLLGLLLGLVLPRLPPWAGLVATLVAITALYAFDTMLVFPGGHWMMLVYPTIQLCAQFLGITVYGYLTEGREKQKIKNAFQFYLSKSVVDEVLQDPTKLSLGGEKRVCTVLFSDIRGFTTISERLAPEQLSALLNQYLTPMTNIVFKHQGTLDKYMGDAIMAIFGAPVRHGNHASQACFVALEMMEDLRRLHEVWRSQGLPELDIGIGMNTGPMSVGNMGSEVRFDYTVMGDNVNLGSRLEGINKQYGTNIIISEATYLEAQNDIYARHLDSVRVKGKREPVQIYELLGKGDPTPEHTLLMKQFQQSLVHYRSQEWNEAIAILEIIRKETKPDDFASGVYIKRCETMRDSSPPGPDWDGVFTMTSK